MVKLKLVSRESIFIFAVICIIFLIGYYQMYSQTIIPSHPQQDPMGPVNCPLFGFGDLSSSNNLIYDFFILNNELDMLEIRLYELYDFVTLFLIAESNITFSGKPKPLYLKENWSRFRRYHNKIRRVEVNDKGRINNTFDAWAFEAKMRDEGIRLGLPHSSKEFLLLTSDLDEIPKARFIQALALCQLYVPFQPALLQCDYHYYSFEYTAVRRHFWPGGTLSKFSPNAKIPSDLRKARLSYRYIPDACFHCSFCFDTMASVHLKLSSFSHTELDIEKYHDEKFLIGRFQNGVDILDRFSEELRRSDVYDTDLPRLLKAQPNRFMYMLNRSSLPNAGFRDV